MALPSCYQANISHMGPERGNFKDLQMGISIAEVIVKKYGQDNLLNSYIANPKELNEKQRLLLLERF